MREINEDGLVLLKTHEGCRLSSYQDVGGIWTIGYGDTGPDVGPGLNITQEQADERLKNKLAYFEAGVERYVTAPINDNQFSALVCFSYNIGLGNLQHSTLLNFVNAGMYRAAADQFLAWNKVKGVPVEGLTQRRLSERALFLKGDNAA